MTTTLDTKNMQDKLECIGYNIPEYADCIYELLTDFCKYLSTRLNPQLVPEGFFLSVELVLFDIKSGVSGFSHLPLPASLPGYPPIMYIMLRKIFFDDIFPQVCDNEEFIKEVLIVKSEVEAESAGGNSIIN